MRLGSSNAPADVTLEELSKHKLRHSRSNPDITQHQVKDPPRQTTNNSLFILQLHPSHSSDQGLAQYYRQGSTVANATNGTIVPEHVLKVYRADQQFKYLTVHRDTSAQNVVQLALHEFGLAADVNFADWSLFEV